MIGISINRRAFRDFGKAVNRIGIYKFIAKKVSTMLYNKIEELENEIAFKERAMLNQRIYLKKIIDHNPHFIYAKNQQGKYTMVNQATADLFGSSIDELIGLTNEDINPYLNNNEVLNKQDLQVFSTGLQKFIPLEPMVDKKGRLYWFQTIKTPIRNHFGEVEEVISVSTDITKRVEVENELRQKEERYRSIYENNYAGIIVVDQHNRIADVNKAFTKIIGLSEKELSQTDFFKLIRTQFVEESKSLFKGLMKREFTQFNVEMSFESPSGSVIYTNAFVSGLYDEDNNYREAVITVQDVTKDKLAAKQLKESEERFRTLVENAPEAILMLDYDSRDYILANENAERLLGYSQHELVGSKLGDFTPLKTSEGRSALPTLTSLMQQAVAGTKVVHEWEIQRKDGVVVPCEVRIVKIPAKDRTLLRISVIDITERKRSEQMLQNEKERIEAANKRLTKLNGVLNVQKKQLSDFAYIASHNLRAPAGNIKQLIAFHGDDDSAEGKKYFHEQMNLVADNLLDTINDLAEVVKIKSRSEMSKDNVDLTKTVEKILTSINREVESSGAKVTCHFDEVNTFQFSKSYLESMLHNLLTNAIKYRHPDRKPEIEVRSYDKGTHYQITCKDNGLGLDLDKYGDKVFGLRKTFHRHPNSKGVGLFITKAQVESFGGSIEVDSEPNKGATFTITLPKQTK
jgi:PAS domain S-box-containing protein